MNKTKVIALSGASGSGKTTVVKQLAQMFNCPFLLFDDYVDINTYPNDMKSWLKNGANVSVIKTPNFVRALEDCLSRSIADYIFIEEPFGRERDALSPLVDTVILLDQPLSHCLARIEARHAGDNNSFARFMEKYDDYFRDIYRVTVKQVSRNSDLIISGGVSIDDTLGLIIKHLKANAK